MIKTYLRVGVLLICVPLFAKITNEPTEPIESRDNWYGISQKSEESTLPPLGNLNGPIAIKLNNKLEYYQHPAYRSHKKSSSGYYALLNSFLSVGVKPGSVEALQAQEKMKDNAISEVLFGDVSDPWRNAVIEKRKVVFATDYLNDAFLLAIKGGKKLDDPDLMHAINGLPRLFLDPAVVSFDSADTNKAQERSSLITLLVALASRYAELPRTADDKAEYVITSKALFQSVAEEALKKSDQTPFSIFRNLTDVAVVASYFDEKFTEIRFTLESKPNENIITVPGTNVTHKRSYLPSNTALIEEGASDGSYLTSADMQSIAQYELANPSGLFKVTSKIPVECLESAPKLSQWHSFLIDFKARWLKEELAKTAGDFHAIMPINCEGQWIGLVAERTDGVVRFVVADTLDLDRSLEPAILKLIGALEINEKKPDSLFKDEPFNFKPQISSGNQEEQEEKINYDAPLAHRSLDKLPSLEQLFGNKIPNTIKLRLHQMKSLEPIEEGTEVGRALLLYGPPGTGKTTIAQIMARMAGRAIIYVGGGAFRTAFQGSAKKLIDALFNEALRRNEPVVILIDEIDGATSKVEPHTSTQEDNRSIKAFITQLDMVASNPNIYVIATSNYPDKIDGAIMRRFTPIEIPNPHYELRKQQILYYLDKNRVVVAQNNPEAVTPDFIDCLATATDGLSGDAIKKIINEGVQYYKAGYEPEEAIGLRFRLNKINMRNKSITSTMGDIFESSFMLQLHMLDGYGNTQLDHHMYAQLVKVKATKSDIEEKERANLNKKASLTWGEMGKNIAWEGLTQIPRALFLGLGTDLLWPYVKSKIPAIKRLAPAGAALAPLA